MTALYGQALSRGGTGTTTNNSPPFHAVDDGYQIFVLRVLAVPPTRFRPSRKVDADTEAEHPQNICLSKVNDSCVVDTALVDKKLEWQRHNIQVTPPSHLHRY